MAKAQIQARENEMRQQAVSTTRQALKEHFVLDKIADKEEIEVLPERKNFLKRLTEYFATAEK